MEGVGFPIYDNLEWWSHTHACTIAWRGGSSSSNDPTTNECGRLWIGTLLWIGTISIPNNMKWFGIPTPPNPYTQK